MPVIAPVPLYKVHSHVRDIEPVTSLALVGFPGPVTRTNDRGRRRATRGGIFANVIVEIRCHLTTYTTNLSVLKLRCQFINKGLG